MLNRRNFTNIVMAGGASSVLPKSYVDSAGTKFKFLPNINQNCF